MAIANTLIGKLDEALLPENNKTHLSDEDVKNYSTKLLAYIDSVILASNNLNKELETIYTSKNGFIDMLGELQRRADISGMGSSIPNFDALKKQFLHTQSIAYQMRDHSDTLKDDFINMISRISSKNNG